MSLVANLLTSRLVAFDQISTTLQATRAALFFQINWPYLGMMGGWVVFRKIISPVFISWLPENFELALLHSILKPIESHINSFCTFLFDGFVEETVGCAVVGLDRGRGLFMTHFEKCISDGFRILAVDEDGANFRFCSGGHYISHNGGNGVYRSVGERGVNVV